MEMNFTFKPVSRKQAQLKLLERIALCTHLYTDKDISFYSPVEDVKTPRDLEFLLDSIYYVVKDNVNNLSKANKILDKRLHEVSLNWKDYFIFRYELDDICLSKTISSKFYAGGLSDDFCCIVVTMLQYIEVCKLKTNSNAIVDVDIVNNRVQTVVAPKFYDSLAGVLRTELETKLIRANLDIVMDNYTKATGKAPTINNYTGIYDRLDDTLRFYQSSYLLTKIINHVTRMDFKEPVLESHIAAMALNTYVIYDKESLKHRKRLSSYRGTVIDVGCIKLIVKDVSLSDSFKCIICQHEETRYGFTLTGTSIFPLNISGFISGQSPDSVITMLDYYNDELDTDKDIELYDYVDKHTYNKASKDREYREVSIAPYLRRAGSASDKAKKLAREYGLELPEGYTLVDEHIRHYNKDMKIN